MFPSLSAVLSSLPVGCVVSPSLVPFAACVPCPGAPVAPACLLSSLPAGLLARPVRVCARSCGCGCAAARCGCASLALAVAPPRVRSCVGAGPVCVLVWLSPPPPPAPPVPPSLRAALAACAAAPGPVAVVGSRSFAPLGLVSSFVRLLPPGCSVVSGAAPGVDAAAEAEALACGLPVVSLPAAWSRFGRAAGMRRNGEVVARASLVVAFWDGVSPGTRDAIARARRAGLPVFVVAPPPAPGAPVQPSLF